MSAVIVTAYVVTDNNMNRNLLGQPPARMHRVAAAAAAVAFADGQPTVAYGGPGPLAAAFIELN